MRDLSKPIDHLDLVDMMYTRAQSTMHAEDRIVDDYAEREKVEHVSKVVPDVRAPVFPRTFEIEAIRLMSAL